MRRIIICVLALLAPVAYPAAPAAEAEDLGPGEYTGWVVQDRWGDVHLANGTYLITLRGKAKERALAWKDQAVTMDATEVDGQHDHDHWIRTVEVIRKTKPLHGGRLRIELQQPEICPPPKARQELDLYVRYDGKEKIRIDLRRLKVVARRRGPPLPEDDRAEGLVLTGRDARGTPWLVGGRSMEVLESGKRARHQQVFKASGGDFEVEGRFTYHTTLSMTLPEGEYEFFAVLGEENFSEAPAPRSALQRIDIIGE